MKKIKIKEGVEVHPDLVTIDGEYNFFYVLGIVADVYDNHGQVAVLTSFMDGKHSDLSLHYSGEAYDFRTFYFDDITKLEVIKDLKEKLGSDFDVVLEPTHIHIEYDPK